MTEKQIVTQLNEMCEQSLSPDAFEKWQVVKEQLYSNRSTLKNANLSKAIDILTDKLREDKSEGSYYYSWQANIAMAFKDGFNRYVNNYGRDAAVTNVHQVANNAAKEFLDTFIK